MPTVSFALAICDSMTFIADAIPARTALHRAGARPSEAAGERLRVIARLLLQQIAEIEPPREHCELAVPRARPLRQRAIPVELDAVVVGIAEVKRLADPMVGGAFEWNFCIDQSTQRVTQSRARWIENRQMIEAGGAGRGRCAAAAFPGVETNMMVVVASRDKGDLRSHALLNLESKNVAVERERAIDVGNLQMHVTYPDAGINRSGRFVLPLTMRSDGLLSHGLPPAAYTGRCCRRRLALSGLRCPFCQGRDAQRGDAVAVAAQHAEPEAVEGEGLAGVWNRARFVDDETGDGSRFLVGQVPIHDTVEIADRHAAVDIDRAVGLRAHAWNCDIALVGDVDDDVIQKVLQRDQAHHLAVFVHDQRERRPSAPERLELLGQWPDVRHKPGWPRNRLDVELRYIVVGLDRAQQILGVQNANDVFGLAA